LKETGRWRAEPGKYPKVLHHPAYPIGVASGLLVKDYRAKNAEHSVLANSGRFRILRNPT
jgi:hypothetical protein